MRTQHVAILGIVVLLAAGSVPAQTVHDWSAPSMWSPPGHGMTASAMSDVSGPVPFIPVTPCRVADTRGNGFTGAYGPPAIAGGASRDFPISGQCGIPAGVAAVSFNFTILSITTAGDIRVYPTGGTMPLVSTQNWTAATGVIANAAVTPLGSGSVSVHLDGLGAINLIIDVNGYYSTTPANAANYLQIINNSGLWTIEGINTSTTCAGACGILGQTSSGTAVYGDSANSYGVYGVSSASGLGSAGVYGFSTNAIGTEGYSSNTNGMWAQSTNFDALAAFGGRDGTFSQGARYGVFGVSTGTTGGLDGVLGVTDDTTGGHDAAGVKGTVTGQDVTATGYNNAGVRGENAGGTAVGFGVLGLSVNGYGTAGYLFSAASGGSFVGGGVLGVSSTIGIYCFGNFAATGTKSFVEPDPVEAGKVIDYVALEGPEAGTYFRGRGHISGGQAVILVPDSFRMVTDPDGLTVQVTPIGRLASFAVVQADLNRIVVQSDQDVDFYYLVNGVRAAFKDHQAIRSDTQDFVPASADAKIPAYLPASLQQRLIANGTYNEDGTVNMDTAQRLGWVQMWRDRDAAMQASAEAAKAKQAADRAASGYAQSAPQ
jgi:hypothetical protein